MGGSPGYALGTKPVSAVLFAIYNFWICCMCTRELTAHERPMLYSYSRPIREAALPLSRHGRSCACVPQVFPANVQPEGLRLLA
jgi:hypothetical protein